jgi:membrane fusion protein (multidrug efflux system)
MTAATPERAPRNGTRRRWLMIATLTLVGVALGYTGYWAVYQRNFERTDDAYVQGNLVQVTPQVSGTVISVGADDTDFVKAGQPLVTLDRADAQVALEQAQAALAQTVREVRMLYVANATWGANIAQREAEVVRAKSELARADDDLARRESLRASGAVSGEEMNHAQTGVNNARAALAAAEATVLSARQQLATNQSLTDGTTIAKHPNVERAAAKLREAYLAYARTSLPSPVSGYVAKRTVQVGQRVAPGAPMMAIVPLDQLWVDANFKEVQLRRMRIGQPVTLVADAYGNAVKYHGTVVGLGVGTGGAFALLPAQNATGNWIKVVQRLPVRVALDATELAQHPLRVGLSMEAEVDVADASGASLATAPRSAAAYKTDAFNHDTEEADALVSKTIAANLGGAMKPAATSVGTATDATRLAAPASPRSAPPLPTVVAKRPAAAL